VVVINLLLLAVCGRRHRRFAPG